MKKMFGYTLIELVVVAGILGIIGVTSVALFLSTIRGGGKSSALNDVRSNGDYAITQMERMIRSARGVVDPCVNDMTEIEIRNPDGGTTVFSSTLDGTIASNAASLAPEDMLSASLMSNDVFLDGIMDVDCVRQDSNTTELVTINFTLEKGDSSSKRDYATADFSTTVQLRSF